MKVTLLHNPNAGNNGQPSGDDIVDLIRNAGHSVVYHSTKDVDWHKVLHESPDVIAVAGGDGSVDRIAKCLVGKNIPMTILPMGTANNVANALGFTDKSHDLLIEGWSNARRIRLDVGVANGPWGSTIFIEGLGAGLFTNMMSRVQTQGNVDHACLNASSEKVISALEIIRKCLISCPASRMSVSLDDQQLSGEYVLLEAMNIRTIGPNLALAPAADPTDGLLDLVLVSKAEREQMTRYLSEHIEGKQSSPVLCVRRSRQLRIECQGLSVHMDDELWPEEGSPPPATMIIDVTVGASLEMLTPA
jgi:diacylglycerol kinase (ATP)